MVQSPLHLLALGNEDITTVFDGLILHWVFNIYSIRKHYKNISASYPTSLYFQRHKTKENSNTSYCNVFFSSRFNLFLFWQEVIIIRLFNCGLKQSEKMHNTTVNRPVLHFFENKNIKESVERGYSQHYPSIALGRWTTYYIPIPLSSSFCSLKGSACI